MDPKICRRCGQSKDVGDFFRNSRNKDGLQDWCKGCKKEHDHRYFQTSPTRKERVKETNRQALQANRERILAYLTEHPCVDCGEADPVVLEFDHQDRHQKKACLSNLVRKRASWGLILVEIQKCVVRCANCHRRKTAKECGYYKAMPL